MIILLFYLLLDSKEKISAWVESVCNGQPCGVLFLSLTSSFHGLFRQKNSILKAHKTVGAFVATLRLILMGCCSLQIPAGTWGAGWLRSHYLTNRYDTQCSIKQPLQGLTRSSWLPGSCFWPRQIPNSVGPKMSSFVHSKGQSPHMEKRCCPSAAPRAILPTSTLARRQGHVLMIC